MALTTRRHVSGVIRGIMEKSVEKSCWGITLWAIAVALVVVLIATFVMGPETTVSATTILTVSG
ncbi:MAG: hypothetical protein GKR97_18690 [Rhizobiaceae bacterium]|nr:hypothetical protein [Rhizobiaceae bacterium]